jgi:hypothetical protein
MVNVSAFGGRKEKPKNETLKCTMLFPLAGDFGS